MMKLLTYEDYLFEAAGERLIRADIFDLASKHDIVKKAGFSLSGKEKFPSEEIDKKIGTRISTKWKMPRGTDEHKVGQAIDVASYLIDRDRGYEIEEYLDFHKDLYKIFMKLNPELRKIKVSGTEDKRQLIVGAVSRFNFSDLEYWVEKGIRGTNYPKRLQDRKDKLEKTLNLHLGWVPSEETIEEIENHVRHTKHYR